MTIREGLSQAAQHKHVLVVLTPTRSATSSAKSFIMAELDRLCRLSAFSCFLCSLLRGTRTMRSSSSAARASSRCRCLRASIDSLPAVTVDARSCSAQKKCSVTCASWPDKCSQLHKSGPRLPSTRCQLSRLMLAAAAHRRCSVLRVTPVSWPIYWPRVLQNSDSLSVSRTSAWCRQLQCTKSGTRLPLTRC